MKWYPYWKAFTITYFSTVGACLVWVKIQAHKNRKAMS